MLCFLKKCFALAVLCLCIEEGFAVITQQVETAPGVVEQTIEVVMDNNHPKGAMDKALENVVHSLVNTYVPVSQRQKKGVKIKNKILSQSFRFILSSRVVSSTLLEEKGLHRFIIQAKYSLPNFRKVLLNQGLFYPKQFSIRILPLLVFEDVEARLTYGWWRGEKAPYFEHERRLFFNSLQTQLLEKGFFLINPQFIHLSKVLPRDRQFKTLSKKVVSRLAKDLGVDLVMTGYFKIRPSDEVSSNHLSLQLIMHHISTERTLASVNLQASVPLLSEKMEKPSVPRSSEKSGFKNLSFGLKYFLSHNPGFAKNLGVELKKNHDEGTLHSHLIEVDMRIKDLNQALLKQFKGVFLSRFPFLFDMKPYIMDSDSAAYFVYSNRSSQNLLKEISKTSFSPFHVKAKAFGSNGIRLKIKH